MKKHIIIGVVGLFITLIFFWLGGCDFNKRGHELVIALLISFLIGAFAGAASYSIACDSK